VRGEQLGAAQARATQAKLVELKDGLAQMIEITAACGSAIL
jgi:hypothetical protein